MSIFYKPQDGWLGDVIPFFWEGEYHLFYIKDIRNLLVDHTNAVARIPESNTLWFHIETGDFINFVDYGQVLNQGPEGAVDYSMGTGCVVHRDGEFHLFYCGLNDSFQKSQAVMHAISRDLIHWNKIQEDTFFSDDQIYDPIDWRDPFVFWNEDTDEYWMLLAARLKSGPINRRGCVALLKSSDLRNWQVADPFWAPYLDYTHECPDLFKIGDWWYLVYSTFSDRFVTHYRMSKNLSGPWLAPREDTFDNRAFYAAKTASDGKRRFVFGWNPTKEGMTDEGPWQWGGNLVTHEIIQRSDGTLVVKLPEEIESHFRNPVQYKIVPQIGNWQIGASSVSVDTIDSFAWCHLSDIADTFMIKTKIKIEHMTKGCGIFLRAGNDLEYYYQVRVELLRNRVVFDRSPRPGDETFMLEKFLDPNSEDAIEVKVIVDNTIIEIYVDDTVALSTRGYNHSTGSIGLFVSEGKVTFLDTEISTA